MSNHTHNHPHAHRLHPDHHASQKKQESSGHHQNAHKETCSTMLKILTGKNHVTFTSRCNESIKLAMLAVAQVGRHSVLFQEEGGWLTYEKYINQANLNPIKMITDHGLIYEKELARYDYDIALLINSLAGYIASHDMEMIHSHCLKSDIFLVNDVSGSIGSKDAKFGDIIVGSFGHAKPINLGAGGFIATSDDHLMKTVLSCDEDFQEPELDFVTLAHKLKHLEERRVFLQRTARTIKKHFADSDVVHREQDSLNVVIKYSSDEEKSKIIDYCDEQGYDHTVCPREIRILDDAISIEVKRLHGPK